MTEPPDDDTSPTRSFWRSRYALGFLVFGAIAAFFLIKEHTAHLQGALPYVLLIAFPVLHLFMHGGHGHRHHAETEDATPTNPTPRQPRRRH